MNKRQRKKASRRLIRNPDMHESINGSAWAGSLDVLLDGDQKLLDRVAGNVRDGRVVLSIDELMRRYMAPAVAAIAEAEEKLLLDMFTAMKSGPYGVVK